MQYSAPSRLIGHRLMVRLYTAAHRVLAGRQCVLRVPAADPASDGQRHPRDIDYRHLMRSAASASPAPSLVGCCAMRCSRARCTARPGSACSARLPRARGLQDDGGACSRWPPTATRRSWPDELEQLRRAGPVARPARADASCSRRGPGVLPERDGAVARAGRLRRAAGGGSNESARRSRQAGWT